MAFPLPPGINIQKNNIFDIALPYYLLDQPPVPDKECSWVLFWGVPFRNLPSIYADESEFVRRANECLEYIQQRYPAQRLIYKPHPNETDETSFLNLAGFEVLPEKTVSEFFILKNASKICRVFSMYSSAAMTSYKLGLQAHIFLPYIESTLTPLNRDGNREYFKRMPKEFFIDDLKQAPKLCQIRLADSPHPELSGNIARVLSAKKSGTVWFTLGDPGSLTSVIALSRLAKHLSPSHALGLLVERHHRWSVMNMDEVGKFFDTVLVYPRWLASVRPNKLLGQIKTARSIRKAPIGAGDVIICMNYTSFMENCFLSYFPQNPKIAFLKRETLEFCYGQKEKTFFDIYFSRIGHRFYEMIVQPILGLYPTIFREDPVRVANFDRYLMPVNDLYDQVYIY